MREGSRATQHPRVSIHLSLGRCITRFLKIRVTHGRGFRRERPRGVGETCGEVWALNCIASSLKAAGSPAVGAAGAGGGGWLCGERRYPLPRLMACWGPSAGSLGLVCHWCLELPRVGMAAERRVPHALPPWVAVALRMFCLFPLLGEERMAS